MIKKKGKTDIMRKPLFRNKIKNNIQTKSAHQNIQLQSDFETRLQSSKGNGNPLPQKTRNEMESNFGVDFSRVKNSQ